MLILNESSLTFYYETCRCLIMSPNIQYNVAFTQNGNTMYKGMLVYFGHIWKVILRTGSKYCFVGES